MPIDVEVLLQANVRLWICSEHILNFRQIGKKPVSDQRTGGNDLEMRRLFLGAIDDKFNPERDLAIGPWCFVQRDKVAPDWEKINFFRFNVCVKIVREILNIFKTQM